MSRAVVPKLLFPFYKIWISLCSEILYSSLRVYLLQNLHLSSNSQVFVSSGPRLLWPEAKNCCCFLAPLHWCFFLVNRSSVFSVQSSCSQLLLSFCRQRLACYHLLRTVGVVASHEGQLINSILPSSRLQTICCVDSPLL